MTDNALPQAAFAEESSATVPPMQQVQERFNRIEQSLQDLGGHSSFLRQQINQLHDAVRQLYGAVSGQCLQLRESDLAIQEELRKFQSAGTQRAMAGIFCKLLRDMLKHMNQLDDLVRIAEKRQGNEGELSWSESLRVCRDGLETILAEWGCTAIPIQLGEEEFNPEIHEAVEPVEGKTPESGRITFVVRRGWRTGDVMLQAPQVTIG
jgi:molecular chaperone GrpE (heat shock protein)